MRPPLAAVNDLLFGVLALQNGLIDQGQLVGAFQAWTRDRDRRPAEYLVACGALDGDQRDAIEAMALFHLKKFAGDSARGLASIPVGRGIVGKLGGLGDADLEASIELLDTGIPPGDVDAGETMTYALRWASFDDGRFQVLRPHAKGGLGEVLVALDQELHRQVALKRILERHADDPAARELQAIVYSNLGTVLSSLARPAEAFASYRAKAAGDRRGALAVYEASPIREGEYAMFETGCHALLASVAGRAGSGIADHERTAEQEKTLKILREIIEGDYRDPQLDIESALDPLRARPDFRLLMRDVEFPSDPFAR